MFVDVCYKYNMGNIYSSKERKVFNMKKKGLSIGFILVFIFIAINSEAQSSGNEQRIVGTWVGTSDFGDGIITETLVFNADGSGTYTITFRGETARTNFTFGISLTGSIFISGEGVRIVGEWVRMPGGQMFFSPDGRTMFFERYDVTGTFRRR